MVLRESPLPDITVSPSSPPLPLTDASPEEACTLRMSPTPVQCGEALINDGKIHHPVAFQIDNLADVGMILLAFFLVWLAHRFMRSMREQGARTWQGVGEQLLMTGGCLTIGLVFSLGAAIVMRSVTRFVRGA